MPTCSCSLHHCIYLYLCLSSFCHTLFPLFVLQSCCFLSLSHSQSDSTNTHLHLPSLTDSHAGWSIWYHNLHPAPSALCVHVLPLTIIVQSWKNQMSIWTRSDPSQRPSTSRLCYFDWFLNQVKKVEKNSEKETRAHGQVPQVGSLIITALLILPSCSVSFTRGFPSVQ